MCIIQGSSKTGPRNQFQDTNMTTLHNGISKDTDAPNSKMVEIDKDLYLYSLAVLIKAKNCLHGRTVYQESSYHYITLQILQALSYTASTATTYWGETLHQPQEHLRLYCYPELHFQQEGAWISYHKVLDLSHTNTKEDRSKSKVQRTQRLPCPWIRSYQMY